ncbi:MAG TPA: D-alanyl-D-alanine carboxypeptidase/D-alanyl-D-alanine-endopeptidase [Phycisphaerae bacterium]|nr:D-alanyl-D-alanine carboxypeptidase/D-alanyl-D-alanine-endopeptidase [Phycisphaerae bacterium]
MCDRRPTHPARRRVGLCVLALVLGTARPLAAQSEGPPGTPAVQEVRRRLSALLAKLPAETHAGLVVENVADGTRWFAHEPRRPLKPASVLKLFVTAAALERLGPDFRYETRVYARDGELWVIGSGDPGLGDERLAARRGQAVTSVFDEWAAALKAHGIRSLKTIVLDDGIFDHVRRHPDWPAEQADTWYQAPVGGLNFNDNCLDARVGLRNGVVDLVLQPPLPTGFIRNELAAGKQHRPSITRGLNSDVFVFRGTVARTADLRPTSVGRPSVFFGHALRLALESRGIDVAGQVVRRNLSPTAVAEATPLATHSTPLPDVLWRCNAFSQNLFAECLLKSLAAYEPSGGRSGRPGSWEDGVRVLHATLSDLGLTLEGAVFRDGSGLSHENRVAAGQVVQLLSTMWRHRHSGVFLENLSVAGREGTLRHQLDEPLLRERIRGKTGTIRGVRALAGYAARPDGTTLSFALLVNGVGANDLARQVCRVLVEAGVADQ